MESLCRLIGLILLMKATKSQDYYYDPTISVNKTINTSNITDRTIDPNSIINIYDDDIINNIMKRYSRDIRPGVNVNVSVTLSLRQLVAIDQVNQIMSTSIYLISNWIDKRLEWNPMNYSNLSEIFIPATKIWVPDFNVINAADGSGFISISSTNLVYINNLGYVNMILSITGLKTKCKLNFYYYPFDIQNCSIIIGSWQYDTTRIDFTSKVKGIDMSNYITNPTWTLLEYRIISIFSNNRFVVKSGFQSEDIAFYLTLKRGPLYTMINSVFPCLLLNSVTLLSFFLPFASQVPLGK